ncbi:MAG: hypothetical protein ACFFDF_12120 [Candidatus Odinarchaeota archaeon]
MNDLERLNQLLDWYAIKRKYISGIILTMIGVFTLIIGLIVLFFLFPDQVIYHYNVIIYNGPFIRLCLEITITSIGGLLLLIGMPLFIINTIKRNKLTISKF